MKESHKKVLYYYAKCATMRAGKKSIIKPLPEKKDMKINVKGNSKTIKGKTISDADIAKLFKVPSITTILF